MPLLIDTKRAQAIRSMSAFADIADRLVGQVTSDNVDTLVSKFKTALDTFSDQDYSALAQKGYSATAIQAFLKELNSANFFSLGSADTALVDALLSDVKDFSQGFKLPLIEAGNELPDKTIEAIVISGSYSANATASVTYISDRDWLTDRDINGAGLEYKVDGQANAGIEGAFSSDKGVSIGVDAGVSVTAKGNVQTIMKASQGSLALALYQHAKAMSVKEPMAVLRSDYFTSVTATVEGGVRAYANISAGYAYTLGTNPIAPGADSVGVKLTAKAGVDYTLNGRYEMLCYENNGRLFVEAVRSRKSAVKESLTLSATLETPGAKDLASDYLKKAASLDEKMVEFIEKIEDPKSQILDYITQQMKSKNILLQELVQVAVGQRDADEFVKKVSDEVASLLSPYLTRYDEWKNDAGEITRIAGEITTVLDLDAANVQVSFIESLIAGTVEEWESKLKDAVLDFKNSAKQSALQPLADLGFKVDAQLTTVNDVTEELLAPVHAFRKRIKSRLDVIEEFINTTMIEEVGLAYSLVNQTDREKESVIKVSCPLNALQQGDVNKYVASCFAGDFSELLAELQQDENYLGFKLEDSSTSAMLKEKRSATFTFNLFGLKSVSSLIYDEDIKIHRNGHGQLALFKAETDFKRINTFEEEKCQVSFSSTFNFLLQNESKASFNILYSDDVLTRKELNGFISQYLNSGIITKKQADSLEKAASSLREKGAVILQIAVSLDSKQLLQACSIDDQIIADKALNAYCDAYTAFNLDSDTTIQRGADVLLSIVPGASLKTCFEKYDTTKRISLRNSYVEKYVGNTSTRAFRDYRQCTRCVHSGLSDARDAMVNYLTNIENELTTPIDFTKDDDSLQKQKASALRELNRELDELLHEPYTIFGYKLERVHPTVVGLLLTLNELCEGVDIITTVYQQDSDGKVTPVVIV